MGGFNPSPTKAGAEAGHIEEVLLDSLLEADGTALSKETNSYVYAERLAESRALAYLWHTNRRLANQWDADRMTDFLPRWEKILGVRPLATDTEVERRAKVKAKQQMYGSRPTQQVVADLLTAILGSTYVGIVNTTSGQEIGYVAGGCSVPGGVTLPNGTPLGLSWYSTIAYVAIQVMQPGSMDAPTFYATVAQIYTYLDDLMPAWVTFAWFRDGLSGAGFILDDDGNLDNERFDL